MEYATLQNGIKMPMEGFGVFQVRDKAECKRSVLDAIRAGYRLIDLCQFVEVTPAVNQVETHVFQQQKTAHEYMEKYGVQHESWGPFAEGRKDFFSNPVLTEIGRKYGKSSAQTALRFLLQSNVVVIPKSTHKERMAQNIDVFDFTLSEADMEAIRKLDEGESLFFSHYDPATVEMLTNMGKTRKA